MANCKECGTKLNMFDVGDLCKKCYDELMAEINAKEKKERELQKLNLISIREKQREDRELQREYRELQKLNLISIAERISVTNCDSSKPYEVIGPIMFNTTNRGIFSSAFGNLVSKYRDPVFNKLLLKIDYSPSKSDNAELAGNILSLFDFSFGYEGNVGQSSFDSAFYICLAELKIRAAQLGGDEIIGMRMDFDLDTTDRASFYIQMYGTVIKYI